MRMKNKTLDQKLRHIGLESKEQAKEYLTWVIDKADEWKGSFLSDDPNLQFHIRSIRICRQILDILL